MVFGGTWSPARARHHGTVIDHGLHVGRHMDTRYSNSGAVLLYNEETEGYEHGECVVGSRFLGEAVVAPIGGSW